MDFPLQKTGIDAIVFDIGNVLVQFDFGPAYEILASKSTLGSAAAVEAALEPVKRIYEDGWMTRKEFLLQARERLGYSGTPDELQAIWQDIFTANPGMDRVVQALSGQVPLFLLSNTNDMHHEFLFQRFPLFGLFRGGVFSFEAKVSKPDPEIFRITKQRFLLKPERTLFVDDLIDNVNSARGMGFLTHQYRRGAHADFLRRIGLAGKEAELGG